MFYVGELLGTEDGALGIFVAATPDGVDVDVLGGKYLHRGCCQIAKGSEYIEIDREVNRYGIDIRGLADDDGGV